MSKLGVTLLCAVALAAASPSAVADPPPELPSLTRIASTLSGLPARRKVRVVVLSGSALQGQALRLLDRDYARERQAYDETLYRSLGLLGRSEPLRPELVRVQTSGLLGLYDPVMGTLYVRAGLRSALLHQLVVALEDQSFGLRRLSALRRASRDASLAALAAVEGEASFATEVLGGRSLALARAPAARRPASHDRSAIRVFLGLERDFPSTTGLRFATTLYNLGGKKAIFGALSRFPATTEQIFHVDAFLTREAALPLVLPASAAGFSLSGSDTFGELDVRALLAVFGVPRLDHVGEGWGGGVSAVYRDAAGREATVLRLNWDGPLDAAQWTEAVATYVNEAFDADTPGFPATTPCPVDSCWSIDDRSIAFEQTATETALVFGPSVASAASIAATLLGGTG